MSETNKKTIESYETGIDEYIKNTPSKRGGVVEDWIDRSLEALGQDAKILEIGSAHGRDAEIIEEKGFYVEKTDATKGFVKILQEIDSTARVLDILSDEVDDSYDLIIANAVFLHFNDAETLIAANKVYQALNPDGIFSLTLKHGDGETWQSNKDMAPRFFNLWFKERITDVLSRVGFDNINAWADSSDGSGTTWIMIIAKKL